MERAVSFLGLFVLLGLAYLLSVERRRIVWRPVYMGIVLQFVLAYLILGTDYGRAVFEFAKLAFVQLLAFSAEGASFVFGPLADIPTMGGVFAPASGFLFAVQVSATIIFVSSLMAILYHVGVMQRIVYVMALIMQRTMKVSGAESLSAAANVFVGQTEAPLTVRPYLKMMTVSELNALMCGGMATVAGGVLAAYTGFGIDAGHLLAASVMSAPAALAIAKIIAPEVERSETAGDVPMVVERPDSNLLDAACRGAGEGLKLSLNVMAMLIAFIALMAMVNFIIQWGHYWCVYSTLSPEMAKDPSLFWPQALTLQKIMGWVFAPLAWAMGVTWADATQVGQLLGTKMVLNEFIAFIDLAAMTDLAPRSKVIATYALCGFANFSSIAIQIGGIGALEPGIRPRLAKLGLRAMLGGMLAAMMTATIAGVLIGTETP